MHGRDFGLRPGRHNPGATLSRAVRAAYDEAALLQLEPGEYILDAPVHVVLDTHATASWGISGPGARLVAGYDDPGEILTIEAIGNASVRYLLADGFSLKGRNRTQRGFVLRARGGGKYIYSFNLLRVMVENCDDAIMLDGNVFEGDLAYCHGRGSNCGLALGNDSEGGVLSAINIFGGSYSQNLVDGLRTFGPQYQEPFDFEMFGTYLGNNGRYALNALAGAFLLKGVRMENPWCDPAQFDPDGTTERAGLFCYNFATLEQCNCGGNGNATALVNSYLATQLVMRDCGVSYHGSDAGRVMKLAKLDGKAGSTCLAERCGPGAIEHSANVTVTRT